jgi:hypothetical protein
MVRKLVTNDTYNTKAASLLNWIVQIELHLATHQNSYQAVKCIHPIFIYAHQVSYMICKVTSLKLRIKTPFVLEDIAITSHKVFQYFGSDMAVGI